MYVFLRFKNNIYCLFSQITHCFGRKDTEFEKGIAHLDNGKLFKCWLGRGIAEKMNRRQKLVATRHALSLQERPAEAPFLIRANSFLTKANCNGKPDPDD